MSPLDIAQAVPVTTAEDFDRFLRDHGAAEREVIAAIFKRASGKQTVTLAELQERAIVFVTEIPRTATGKPLRGELAAAVAAMLAPASAASMSSSRSENPNDLTAKVAEIWAAVFGFGPVAGDDDLFDLGVDSLQIMRMLAALQQEFAVEVPPGVLFEERTPARVAAWIAAANPPATGQFKPDVGQREGGKRAIFFVSSATSSGKNPLRVARLGSAIDPERPVHDLAVPPRLIESSPDDPDEAVRTATVCIDAARAEQASEPYLVVGIGEGGVIACEMARQWERGGETVHLLLIDAWSPSGRRQRPSKSDLSGQAASASEHFAGPVTLIANRDALAEDATLGWGDAFGARLRVVPTGPHTRPRRMQAEIAGAVRSWLAAVDPARARGSE